MEKAPISRTTRARASCGALATLVICAAAAAEQLPIRIYDGANGLPADAIRCALADSRGYLWFGTTDGLSRFDGEHFTNLNVEAGLPTGTINTIIETRDGAYWVGTTGGIGRYAPAEVPARAHFTSIPREDGQDVGSVLAVVEDPAGAVWVASGATLLRVDPSRRPLVMRRVPIPSGVGPRGWIQAIAIDRDRSLWLASDNGLTRVRSDGNAEHFAVKPQDGGDRVHGVFVDRDGRLWVAHGLAMMAVLPDAGPAPATLRETSLAAAARRLGLLRSVGDDLPPSLRAWEPFELTYPTQFESNLWDQAFQDHLGRLWLPTAAGVAVVDGRRTRMLGRRDGLPDAEVTTIAEDRGGNLWMGTDRRGVMRVSSSGFSSYGLADGLAEVRVGQVFTDRDGSVIAVTGSSRFLHRFRGRSFEVVKPPRPETLRASGWGWGQTVVHDQRGEWWVATGQGLLRYPSPRRFEDLARTRPKALYTTRDGLGGDDVFRVFEDHRGDLWLGTFGTYVLTRWDRATGAFHRFAEKDGVPIEAPTAFGEDGSGDVWIGFYGGGLVRYRNGVFRDFRQALGAPLGFVFAVYFDSQRRLWIATSMRGLVRVDNSDSDSPRFVAFTTIHGLSSNRIGCITQDALGRLYLGTGGGIDQFDPVTIGVRHYSTADGLPSGLVGTATRGVDGSLWFGTPNGASRLIPRPSDTGSVPSVLVTGVSVDGEPQPVSELGVTEVPTIDIPRRASRVQVAFFGFDFSPGESLRFQHLLEGPQAEWSQPTASRTVEFAGLPYGRHKLLVRAVGVSGEVSDHPVSVELVVAQPFWLRWWFLVAIAAALIGVGALLEAVRTARLVEIERVRTSIATDLHDDLGASLSRISILSEVVRRDIDHHQEASNRLAEIGATARDLIDGLRDNIWAIEPRRDSLDSLIDRARSLGADIFGVSGTRWRVEVHGDTHGIKLTPERRRHLFLILKEALNNVAKHAKASSATVTFSISGARLTLEVADDGVGFDPETEHSGVRHGRGLVNMKVRTAALHGDLQVDAAPGRGSRLKLAVQI